MKYHYKYKNILCTAKWVIRKLKIIYLSYQREKFLHFLNWTNLQQAVVTWTKEYVPQNLIYTYKI